MEKSGDDTTDQGITDHPAWLRQLTGGEILWLGREAVVFFRLGEQGLVLVQRNAWSAGIHELEWVSLTSLQPLDTRASQDEEKAGAQRDTPATSE